MSYILDALRRADSERERERGSVPGIHTQPVPLVSADDAPRRGPSRTLWWLAGAAVLLLLAVLAWLLLGRDTLPADGVAAAPALPGAVGMTAAPTLLPAATASVVAALPAPVTAPMTAPMTAAVTPAPAATAAALPTVSSPALPPALPSTAAAPAAPLRKATASAVVSAPVATSTGAQATPKPVAKAATRVQAAASAATPASAAASAPEGRIYTLNELPDDVRKDLPPLVIGGAMYSENPANRMLIINGQLFHEGDKLAPGLSLEQIKLKSAVLKLKGYRYSISF